MVDWEQFAGRPVRTAGRGSWVAMTTADWFSVGGYDERLVGWGGDDDILFERIARAGVELVASTAWPLVHVHHQARGKVYPNGNAANLALGRTPPHVNYITGRLGVPKNWRYLNLFVGSQCDRACSLCSFGPLRDVDPSYQMTLDEVAKLIDACKVSRYRSWSGVIITGGEPTLWPHLVEATRMISAAKLSPETQVFSNAANAERVPRELFQYAVLRCSQYPNNAAQIGELLRRFGPRNVRTVDKLKHYPHPAEFLPADTLPADCLCDGPLVYRGRVWNCVSLPPLVLRHGGDLGTVAESCELRPGFMEAIWRYDATINPLCRACIGNRKVRKWLKEEQTAQGGGRSP